MPPAVAVDDLSKHYGDVRALDGVSLAVAPGEIFGLLGPKGAGKSTMIRILTGRARPTAGVAWVLGHEVPRELEAIRGQINPHRRDAERLPAGDRHGEPRALLQALRPAEAARGRGARARPPG